jgi:uncharacterized protein Yka (UPF0111/DUF47 family)
MTDSPMALIRKLDQTVAALRELAEQVRRAAPDVTDEELRREMLESAEGLEQRATEMTEAIERLRRRIN